MYNFLSPKLTSNEKKLWTIVTIALIFITTLPILYAWLTTPQESYFVGFGSLAPGDVSLYFSYFEQVKQGHILFKDLYTSEVQTRTLFIPFFAFWGFIGKILHLNNPLLYQVARITHLIAFMSVLSYAIAYFFHGMRKRTIALFFTLFASGLGGYIAPFFEQFSYDTTGYYHWPMDLWVTESNTFLTLYHNPLYIFSLTLLLLTFLYFLLAIETNQKKWMLYGGITALLLIQTHPYHMPTLASIMFVFIVMRAIQKQQFLWRYWKTATVMALIALPAALYWILLLQYDWLLASRINQQGGYVTVWWLTLISYGFLVPLALLGIFSRATRNNTRWLFLIAWLATSSILIHLNFLQHPRRLTEGLQIPLTFLAVEGLFILATKIKQHIHHTSMWHTLYHMRPIRWIAFLLLFCFSQLFVIANDIALAVNHDPRLYRPQGEFAAMQWLKNNTAENAVIFSNVINGNLIPGITGRTVYAGHSSETAFWETKITRIALWYDVTQDFEKKYQFLTQNNIMYVWYSDFEKMLGDFDPRSLPQLGEVFSNNEVTIFEVR